VSRLVEEAKSSKREKTQKKPAPPRFNRFVTFHPTKDQRKFIREGEESLDDLLTSLQPYFRAGCKLVVQYVESSSSCVAVLRETTADWKEARSVSAFHVDSDIALRTLHYAIVTQYPKFPDIEAGDDTDNFYDW